MSDKHESSYLETRLAALEDAISKIEERNRRVETDKAWETSVVRIGFIVGITYTFTAFIFWFIGIERYFQNALIPTVGYALSTLSLSLLKSWWLSNRHS